MTPGSQARAVEVVKKIGEALVRLLRFVTQVRLGGDRIESNDRS
jgi:hypothetical protein